MTAKRRRTGTDPPGGGDPHEFTEKPRARHGLLAGQAPKLQVVHSSLYDDNMFFQIVQTTGGNTHALGIQLDRQQVMELMVIFAHYINPEGVATDEERRATDKQWHQIRSRYTEDESSEKAD